MTIARLVWSDQCDVSDGVGEREVGDGFSVLSIGKGVEELECAGQREIYIYHSVKKGGGA